MPRIVIDLDKPRPAVFFMKQAKEFRELTGKSLLQLDPEKLTEDDFIDFAWVALRVEDPGLTREQVADIVGFPDLKKFIDLITGTAEREKAGPLASGGPSAGSTSV